MGHTGVMITGAPSPPDELAPINVTLGLYLRPLSKVTIVIRLPELKCAGQSISNWDLMERLKKCIVPIQLDGIRVVESTLEAVTFEAELDSKGNMHRVVKSLDGLTMKISGFVDALKVRASEAKTDFPTRIDWDDFYNRQGIRGHPDTVHLAKLPVNWFTDHKTDGPSLRLFRETMATFGEIRAVDIPMCDAYRSKMDPEVSGISQKAYSFGQEVLFEAYAQYQSYKGFLNAMERLKNMKWIRKFPNGKMFSSNVKVDFDRTFHLSEARVKRREAEKEKIIQAQLQAEEEKKKLIEEEIQRKKQEEEDFKKKLQEKELKRRIKHEMERKKLERKRILEQRLAEEERMLKERKKEESRRLLTYCFERIQARYEREKLEREEKLKEALKDIQVEDIYAPDEDEDALRKMLLQQREATMRERLALKLLATLPPVTSSEESEEESEDSSDRKRSEKKKSEKKSKKKKKKSSRERESKEKSHKHDKKRTHHDESHRRKRSRSPYSRKKRRDSSGNTLRSS